MEPFNLSGGPGGGGPLRKVWAVGSGKGGTGKSFLTTSLGITLSKQGKRVILVDADLGCANLHTCLGMNANHMVSLSDFMSGRVSDLADVVIDTPYKNLKLISGAQDLLEIANPTHSRKTSTLNAIRELDFDYILLDLGAGTSYNTLDFFLAANKAILMVIPEPTSVENAYRFIKSAYFRYIKTIMKDVQIRRLVEECMDMKNELGIHSLHDLVEKIGEHDAGMGERLREQFKSIRPQLVVNQVRTVEDVALGFSMRSSVQKYFGIQMDYAGYVEYDDVVWKCARERRPVAAEHPYSSPSRCVERVVDNLLKNKQLELDFLVARK